MQRYAVLGDQVLYRGDAEQVLGTFGDQSFDVILTSPPYNLEIDYGLYEDHRDPQDYLRWLGDIFDSLQAVLSPRGSFFLNVGSSCAHPWTAIDVANTARDYFTLQNHILWVKSLAVGERTMGHSKPIRSERFLNHNFEHLFHFTRNGTVPVDRLAIGVPYVDKCLAVTTEVLAQVDGEVRRMTLASLAHRFESGATCALPSFDFDLQVPVWTEVRGFSACMQQATRRLTLRNGATVAVSEQHRFPVLARNGRAGVDALKILSMQAIEERQRRWQSRPISLYTAADLAPLLPEGDSPLYNEETGYVLGLWLADGYLQKETGVRWAAARDEENDPDFGGFLQRYFRQYFGTEVHWYPGGSEGGCSAYISCATFRALLEEHLFSARANRKRIQVNTCLRHGRTFLRGLVNGYLKGDGHHVRSHGYYTVGCADNQGLIEDLRLLCLLIGYEFKQQRDSITHLPTGSHRRKNFRIRKARHQGRKQLRSNGLEAERLAELGGGPANQEGPVETIDVEVAIDHHMFFLANGMLTHNSNLTRGTRGKNGDRRCAGNVWFIPYRTVRRRAEKGGHPAIFPVELARRCLRLAGAGPDTRVLDPFVGTGTTLVACRELGIPGTGIDLDPAHLQFAQERLEKSARPAENQG